MKRFLLSALILSAVFNMSTATEARAQIEPFIGQIIWVPYNFCPRGWTETNGQIMSIAQNTALFSLLGTTYGGNGQTTFGLPDLRGRVSIGTGQGPGLSSYDLGEVAGTETVTLNASQLPAHSHTLAASSEPASKSSPNGSFLAASGSYRTTPSTPVILGAGSIGSAGGNQPISIVQPYLTLRACIALEGIYPSRN